MKLTFLGTGTSFGVPVVGRDSPASRSKDPRDRRTRHGALVSLDHGELLVDTPPELRLQLLDCGATRVHAVWFTHYHADHVHGIDDLRVFTMLYGEPLPAYADLQCQASLRRSFAYVFDDDIPPPAGSVKPRVTLRDIQDEVPVQILGETILPLGVPHGELVSFGFRVGGLGYITDGKMLSPSKVEALRGVDVLVLNALWFGDPHPTHFNVEEAVAAAREVGARRTFLTHLTHRVTHQELLDRLPDGVEPAYDGLVVDIGDG